MAFTIVKMVAVMLVFGMMFGTVAADDLWTFQLKKSYCDLIKKTRIYKVEELSVHCVGKVDFFGSEVRLGSIFV